MNRDESIEKGMFLDMSFSEEEVLSATKEYFNGDELAANVWMSKYALRDSGGKLLEKTPDDMHRRLAKEFARIEKKYENPLSEDDIFELLKDFKYVVPQGSPMSAIGNDFRVQSLSNCFVVESPLDSYAGILYTDQQQAQIMKRRGGVGFDISNIRPRGLSTANAAGTTDGISVFMERFSATCREVGQGGRRGALMLTISVHHPEIETFINIKRDLTKVTGANISIRVTDEFMNAVESDSEFVLRWPVDSSIENAKIVKTVKAKDIWCQIIDGAHESAEPGVLFWSTIEKNSPADLYADLGYKTISTNPCGEIALSAYDSCRLILMNLSSYVTNPFTDTAQFDFDLFKNHVTKAQRLMDDIVDLELEKIDKIIEKIKLDPEPAHIKQTELDLWEKIRVANISARRTGLGVTGLGDAIAELNICYGSEDSVSCVESIYKCLAVAAHESSVQLAKERGAFPIFEYNRYKSHPFFDRLLPETSPKSQQDFKKTGRRNIALTTTAPAGSVSILTQTSSGIEPVYKLVYKRRKKINPNDTQNIQVDFVDELGDKWQEFNVYHLPFKKWMEVTGKTDVNDSPYKNSTAEEIEPQLSVSAQAAAQRWVEHSISRTVNMPNNISKEAVSDVYLSAWKSGCKGITVYRAGSRAGVLISEDDKKASSDGQPLSVIENHAPKRPKELSCDIHRVTVKGDQYVVLVGLLEGKPYEIFAGLSEYVEIPKRIKQGLLIKNGKRDGVSTYNLKIQLSEDELLFKDIVELFQNKTHGAFTRTISLCLRHGIPVQYLSEQLKKDKHSDITSFSNVIARVLKSYWNEETIEPTQATCPSCAQNSLVFQEGCLTCSNCGYSKCG